MPPALGMSPTRTNRGREKGKKRSTTADRWARQIPNSIARHLGPSVNLSLHLYVGQLVLWSIFRSTRIAPAPFCDFVTRFLHSISSCGDFVTRGFESLSRIAALSGAGVERSQRTSVTRIHSS